MLELLNGLGLWMLGYWGVAGCGAWTEPVSMMGAQVRSLAWLAGMLAGGLLRLARRLARLAGGVARFDGGLTGFARFVP